MTKKTKEEIISRFLHLFSTWEEAFDACRKGGDPLRVSVNGEKREIFPSGNSQAITAE